MIKNVKSFSFTKIVGILSGLLLLCLSAGLFVMSFTEKNISNTNYVLNDISEKTRFENLLLGSYMICREEQEDTLKSLRLIPVDEVKLTLAKMILAFVFSILIYLLLFIITFLVEAVLHLEALSIGLVLENLKIYLLDGVGVFFAISPIIALVARMKKGYWLALVFAEIYSFAGLFASMSNQLKTIYPMTAVFNISGYYDASISQVFIGVVILMVCAILSLFILKGLNRKTK